MEIFEKVYVHTFVKTSLEAAVGSSWETVWSNTSVWTAVETSMETSVETVEISVGVSKQNPSEYFYWDPFEEFSGYHSDFEEFHIKFLNKFEGDLCLFSVVILNNIWFV